MELDHEMSHTSSMTMIVRNFQTQSHKSGYVEHIVARDAGGKAKPFPVFIEWFISQKQIRERMAAVELTRDPEMGGSYFAGGAKPKGEKEITCFKCGAKGHEKSECTSGKEKGGDQKKGGKKKASKPSHKKFWCAVHKDDLSKHCDSISFQDLGRADTNTRFELLSGPLVQMLDVIFAKMYLLSTQNLLSPRKATLTVNSIWRVVPPPNRKKIREKNPANASKMIFYKCY